MLRFAAYILGLSIFSLPLGVEAYEFNITAPTTATVHGTFNASGTLVAGVNEKLSFAAIEIYIK